MAKKPHAGLFKPGQSGNPSGRPKMPKELKEAKTLNQIQVAQLLNKFTHMTAKQLEERFNDPNATTMELMICKIVHQAIKTGDQARMNFLLDRMVGKVADNVNFEGKLAVEADITYVSEWGSVEKKDGK